MANQLSHKSLAARGGMPPDEAARRGSGSREYRRRHLKSFDAKAYHQRAIIETVHFVEKRKMRFHVLARTACKQHKKLVLRAFAYNVGRLEAIFCHSLRVSTEHLLCALIGDYRHP